MCNINKWKDYFVRNWNWFMNFNKCYKHEVACAMPVKYTANGIAQRVL